MKKNYITTENSFNPKYHGDNTENIYKSNFRQIDNRGGDIELDEIIIYDGGDVYGYPKEN